jgi:hypothetical protein
MSTNVLIIINNMIRNPKRKKKQKRFFQTKKSRNNYMANGSRGACKGMLSSGGVYRNARFHGGGLQFGNKVVDSSGDLATYKKWVNFKVYAISIGGGGGGRADHHEKSYYTRPAPGRLEDRPSRIGGRTASGGEVC